MTEWTKDPHTMAAFHKLIENAESDLIHFLENLHQFTEGNMNYLMVFTLGKFVIECNKNKKSGMTPDDALTEALSLIVTDPAIQNYIANFIGGKIHSGVGGLE